MKTRLMELRKRAGYKNRQEIADVLQISLYTYRDWESGRIDIKASDLCVLADMFDCTIDYLVGREVKTDFDDPRERELHSVWNSCCEERKELLRKVAAEFRAAEQYEQETASSGVNIAIGSGNVAGNNNVVNTGTVVGDASSISGDSVDNSKNITINNYN